MLLPLKQKTSSLILAPKTPIRHLFSPFSGGILVLEPSGVNRSQKHVSSHFPSSMATLLLSTMTDAQPKPKPSVPTNYQPDPQLAYTTSTSLIQLLDILAQAQPDHQSIVSAQPKAVFPCPQPWACLTLNGPRVGFRHIAFITCLLVVFLSGSISLPCLLVISSYSIVQRPLTWAFQFNQSVCGLSSWSLLLCQYQAPRMPNRESALPLGHPPKVSCFAILQPPGCLPVVSCSLNPTFRPLTLKWNTTTQETFCSQVSNYFQFGYYVFKGLYPPHSWFYIDVSLIKLKMKLGTPM